MGFRRRYAATNASVEAALDSCDAFGQLLDAAGKVAGAHAEMAGGDVAAMFIALAQFAAAVYPGQLGLVDRVLVACHEVRMRLSAWLRLHLLGCLFAAFSWGQGRLQGLQALAGRDSLSSKGLHRRWRCRWRPYPPAHPNA